MTDSAGERTLPESGPQRDGESALLHAPRLGRYVLIDLVGQGGLGVVYRAYDPELDRKVAVKMLHGRQAEGESNGQDERRLRREAQAIARLNHPNVVSIHDFGRLDATLGFGGGLYVVMELVEGTNLSSWLEKPREVSDVLDVMLMAARGLAAAHDAGLVHRDFKPANVLVGDQGRVAVADFGLARAYAGPAADDDTGGGGSRDGSVLADELTNIGTVMGTPAYMSPEQHAGREADPRSDQYAFCVSLFRALFGRYPFRGRSLRDLLDSKARDTPNFAGRPVPRWCVALLLRGLSFDPERRYPSMREIIDEIERHTRTGRRGWLIAAVGVGLAVGAGVVLRDSAPPCSDLASDRRGDFWGERHHAAVVEAVDAPASDSVVGMLDAYADDWATVYAAACERQRDGDLETSSAQVACLDGARFEFETLLEGLADSGSAERVLSAATNLPPVDACDAATVNSPEAQRLAAVDRNRDFELRREIRKMAVYQVLGLADRIAPELDRLEARAEEVGDRRAIAEIGTTRCAATRNSGQIEETHRVCREALMVAQAAGDPVVWLRTAAVWAPHIAGRAEPASADLLGDLMRAQLEALPDFRRPPSLQGEVHFALGEIELYQGRPARAQPHLERAISVLRAAHGENDAGATRAMNALASALADQARFSEAAGVYRDARRLVAQQYGGQHLNFGLVTHNLAGIYARLGRFEEAETELEGALEILQSVWGPSGLRLHQTIKLLAEVRLSRGNPQAALAGYQRLLALTLANEGPGSEWVPIAHAGIARTMRVLGDCDRALHHADLAEASGPGRWRKGWRISVALERGRCALMVGDLDRAAAALDVAEERAEELHAELELVEVLPVRAAVYRAAKDEDAAARQLARAAEICDGYLEAPAVCRGLGW